jgi:methionine aminotransferase
MSALAPKRRRQPGPGLPGLRLRPAPARRGDRRHARRPQPVPADDRRAALREAVAAKIEALYGRRYDPTPRSPSPPAPPRPSSPPSWPSCARATKSSCWSPATTATCPTSSWPAARVVRVPLTPGTFRPDFDKIARPHAAHPRHHRQQPAQPQRHGLAPGGHAALAGDPAGAHRRAADQRRGLRAHGVRRPAACQRVAHPGLAARAFVVSSFGKTFHVTGWKVGTWPRRRR